MPNSFLRKLNLSLFKGFVNKSASWFSESTNWISQSLFIMWSLIKWWQISICLVLECWTRFLVKLIALVLSHSNGILERLCPKWLSWCFNQMVWAQQLPTAMYYASAVDNATQACFLLCQDIQLDPSKWHVPLVLFLSTLQPAKSESEYPTRFKVTSLGYHRPTSVVPLRYFKILLAAT